MNNKKYLSKSSPRIFSGDTEEDKPISATCFRSTNEYEFIYDMHYEIEIGILYRGEMERVYSNHIMNIQAGQLWISGMWEPHAGKSLKKPCDGITVFIRPNVFRMLNTGNDLAFNWGVPFLLPPAKRPQIHSKFGKKELIRLAKNYKKHVDPVREEPAGALMQGTFLIKVLELILQENPECFKNEVSDFATRESINPALERVFNNRGFVTSKEAARECAMSDSCFGRLFERMMGSSFAKFALEYRLKHVVQDLIKTDKVLETIADEWGFCDLSHLHRVFTKKYGCTPSQYRKKYK